MKRIVLLAALLTGGAALAQQPMQPADPADPMSTEQPGDPMDDSMDQPMDQPIDPMTPSSPDSMTPPTGSPPPTTSTPPGSMGTTPPPPPPSTTPPPGGGYSSSPSGQTVGDMSQSTGPRGVTQQGTTPSGMSSATPDEYPPCSRTVTDGCLQTYERGREPS